MKHGLTRIFAAAALVAATAVATLAQAPVPGGGQAHAESAQAQTLDQYMSRARGASPRNVQYTRQFLDSMFQGISESHVERPPLSRLEQLALEGVREMSAQNPVYTLDQFVQAALDGALTGLDPHSNYLNTAEARQMFDQSSGSFGGIGVQIGIDAATGQLQIVAPVTDAPAARAGVLSGDILTHINGAATLGKSLEEITQMIRGEAGEAVELTIQRNGTSTPLTISVTREIIERSPVTTHRIGNIGYIAISSFSDLATEKLAEAVAQLRADIGSSIEGIVLDLRYNPGGLLDQAIGVSDSFLDNGAIVSTGDSRGNIDSVTNATPGDIARGIPLVVLINGGSASASEIVAGALQDNGRAAIIGTQSFGKGSVQSVIPLGSIFRTARGAPREDAVKITTNLYYTPSGDTIQNHGITPDIRTEFPGTASDGDIGISESTMNGSIVNPELVTDSAVTRATCAAGPLSPDVATLPPALLLIRQDGTEEADYQLLCAIEHLRDIPEYTIIQPLTGGTGDAALPAVPAAPAPAPTLQP